MSILDKPLEDRPTRSRRPLFIAAIVLLLLLIFVAVTGLGNDVGFVAHFVSDPVHFTYSGHSNYVSAVAWSPNGKRIASASGDGTVQVWNAGNGGNVLTYRGHSSDVLAVAWSPDGREIASGSLDATVQVWNASTGATILTYRGHSDAVFSVAWSPDGREIASVGNDGTAQVWNAVTGKTLVNYSVKYAKGVAPAWNSVAWSPDGKDIAIGGNGPVALLDAASGNVLNYYGSPGGVVHAVAFSPDGQYLAIGTSQDSVQVWNVAAVKNVYTNASNTTDVYAVAWSPDGKRIASGSGDGLVEVWDALTGDHLYTYRGHADFYPGHFTQDASVNAVAWSPDGKSIASGSSDNTVQVWQAL